MGRKFTSNCSPAIASVTKSDIERVLKVKKLLFNVIKLTSSKSVVSLFLVKDTGLKAVSKLLSINKVLPSASLKLPILRVIISVASFKSNVIGIEIILFSSEFGKTLEEELLFTSIPTGSAFASMVTEIVPRDDRASVALPSEEDAITFMVKSDLTSPPVTIPKLVNSSIVKAIALIGPEPKSYVVEAPTS